MYTYNMNVSEWREWITYSSFLPKFRARSKICQPNMATDIKENIVRLDIPAKNNMNISDQ